MPNSVMSAPLSDAVEPELLGIAKELRNAWHTPRGLYGYTRRSSMLANYFVVVGYRMTVFSAHGALHEV